MNITGKIALITGAAGGIGRALALEMAKRGVGQLVLVDQSAEVLEISRLVNELLGRDASAAYQGDVTDPVFRSTVYSDVRAKHGTVTICVPSAGVTKDGLAVKFDKQKNEVLIYPLEQFRQVTEINLIAPVYWAMEMVAGVAEERHRQGKAGWSPEEDIQGAVIFIGSVSSLGNKGQIAYAATKAGLEGAAATLMLEAMFHGVRCGVIHPGYTDTAMVRALGSDWIKEKIIPRTTLKRLIQPTEIADAICFMVTNSAVSGSLWVDANWHPAAV